MKHYVISKPLTVSLDMYNNQRRKKNPSDSPGIINRKRKFLQVITAQYRSYQTRSNANHQTEV